MRKHCTVSLPDDPRTYEARLQQIVIFWNKLRTSGETGETTWEVLEPLEQQVTECLESDPPDIRRAESLTAKAAFLIEGCSDL
jgi:hypothetical protein